MRARLIHGAMAAAIPVLIFLFNYIYYRIMKDDNTVAEYKEQVKNSFVSSFTILYVNILLLGLTHLLVYIDFKPAVLYESVFIPSLVIGEIVLFSVKSFITNIYVSSKDKISAKGVFRFLFKTFKVVFMAKEAVKHMSDTNKEEKKEATIINEGDSNQNTSNSIDNSPNSCIKVDTIKVSSSFIKKAPSEKDIKEVNPIDNATTTDLFIGGYEKSDLVKTKDFTEKIKKIKNNNVTESPNIKD